MKPKFNIIPLSWSKRRTETAKPVKPISIEIPDFQLVHNHITPALVTFDNDEVKKLSARIIYNPLTKKWTVNAVGLGGLSVAAEIIT